MACKNLYARRIQIRCQKCLKVETEEKKMTNWKVRNPRSIKMKFKLYCMFCLNVQTVNSRYSTHIASVPKNYFPISENLDFTSWMENTCESK